MAEPDAPAENQMGEDVCDTCGGSGRLEGAECSTCGGTGKVEAPVGGG